MFTMVSRWTLFTFYRVTLKYLYYACHYCILCDPFDNRLGNESLALCVGDCFVPFHLLNLTSGPSANEPKIWSESFVVWADAHWDFLSTVTGYVALMLRTEV